MRGRARHGTNVLKTFIRDFHKGIDPCLGPITGTIIDLPINFPQHERSCLARLREIVYLEET